MGKKSIKDITVQETNDSSILSKASIAEFGYFDDPYLKLFCRRIARRSPLIHRGYYIRAKAIDYVLTNFLKHATNIAQSTNNERVQVFSLGAGFDTSYFRLKSKLGESFGRNCRYIEIDFPDVVKRKVALISQHDVLAKTIGHYRIDDADGTLNADDFSVIPCDLTDLKQLRQHFAKIAVNYDSPSLFFSECVLTYVDYGKAKELLQWIRMEFPHCMLAVYEQIGPDDSFGHVMMKHFDKIQSPLKRIGELRSLSSHELLLTSLEYKNVCCFDMNSFYRMYVDDVEKSRMTSLEVFDEFEEWHLKCSHYCIALGFAGKCEDLTKLLFPQVFLHDNNVQVNATDSCINLKFEDSSSGVCANVRRFGHCVTSLSDTRYFVSGGFGLSLTSGSHCRLNKAIVVTMNEEHNNDNTTVSYNEVDFHERMFHSATRISDRTFFLFGGRLSPKRTAMTYGVYEVNDGDSVVTVLEKELAESSSGGIDCPACRWRHSAVYMQGEVFIHGGRGLDNEVFDDFWSVDPRQCQWKRLKITPPSLLPACHSHSMNVWNDNSLIIYGGLTKEMCALNRICIVTNTNENDMCCVEQMCFDVPLPERYSHSSHVIKNSLIVIGGIEPSMSRDPPIIMVDLVSKVWKTFHASPCDPERIIMLHNHCSVVRSKTDEGDRRVLIIGGGGNCFSFGTHFNERIMSFDLAEIITSSKL